MLILDSFPLPELSAGPFMKLLVWYSVDIAEFKCFLIIDEVPT